jgi:hypothetical protein
MWDSVDPDNSPWGLTLTIAKNLLWDETHRRASRELLVELPERPIHEDVEDAGIARLELWRVARALRKMSPAHRSVLLAEVGGRDVESISAAATKMLRMRARRRLTSILESASASVFAAIGTMRRHAFGFQQFVRRSTPAIEGSATYTVAAIVGAVIVMVPTQGVTSPRNFDEGQAVEVLSTTVHDEPERFVTSGDGMGTDRAAGPAARTSSKKKTPASDHHFTFGDENVGGEARVDVSRKKKKRLLKAPDCEVDPREDEVYVRCTVETPDERYTVEATVRLRVDPEDS